MTETEIESVMQQIEDQRAQNNKHFMKAWRLLFKLAPQEAAQIQADIRKGDMAITELNGRLIGQ